MFNWSDQKIARFWSLIQRGAQDECWPWIGGRNKHGYGVVYASNRNEGDSCTTAHRVAYLLAKGVFDSNLMVLHSCDNPPCCNPAHLRVGTAKDNAQDAILRNRRPTTIKFAPRVRKLSDQDVEEICRLSIKGRSARELAEAYGVARSTISDILNGKTKTHITAGMRIYRVKQPVGRKRLVTEDQVREIRCLSKKGKTHMQIAVLYDVSETYIEGIVNRRLRADVPDEPPLQAKPLPIPRKKVLTPGKIRAYL